MKLNDLYERVNNLKKTQNLFAFGTLRDRDVLHLITGKKSKSVPAVLPNYKAVHIKDKTYPAAIQEKGNDLKGVLVKGLSKDDWKKIDYYEDQLYHTKVLPVNVNKEEVFAQVYVINTERITPTDKKWSYTTWVKKYKKQWLKKIPKWMEEYETKTTT